MFGKKLKQLRKNAGLSQKALASIIFVSQQSVAGWETGASLPRADLFPKIAQALGVTVSALMDEEPRPSMQGGKMIPVLGTVPAGVPLEAIQDILDYEEISADMAVTGEFFGLRIKGSSMEPHIREGDVVIIRCQATADTGDTAVVMVNGDDATVKRIKKEPDGGIWLIPNNPAYDARHFSPAEIETLPVTILGKVVELRRVFR